MAKKGEKGSVRRDKDLFRRITPAQMKLFIDVNLDNQRDKAFMSALWLTGARVNEIIGELKKENIFGEEFDGKEFVVFDELPTLKLKSFKRRSVSIPVDDSHLPFLKILEEYVKPLNDTDILFDFSRSLAWRIVNKCTTLWPHFIRHSRATNLVKEYGFDAFDVQVWMGWTTSEMANTYVELDPRRTARKFLAKR